MPLGKRLRHLVLAGLLSLAPLHAAGAGAEPFARAKPVQAGTAVKAREASTAPADGFQVRITVPEIKAPPPPLDEGEGRPVANMLEAQIVLARLGFSCGPIDGAGGPQTKAALRAFQASRQLEPSGRLDAETRAQLRLKEEALKEIVLPSEIHDQFEPVGKTWVEKSEQKALAYENALEWAAECGHAHVALVRKLNPELKWETLEPGTRIRIPAVDTLETETRAARIVVGLAERQMEVLDEEGKVLAHFPASIAAKVEKRPVGELQVTVVIPNPNYTFDPAVFPESPEARELTQKLIINPGPNNPVGLAWIGLDRPGYGIHGTPLPEQVGRTESHGCFRLANWDAQTLLKLVWVGMPVEVRP